MRPACLFRHRAAFAFVGTPGQREESEHDIGDYEELFTPEGKTHLYRWDNNGMVWPRYHHTQYKHNGTWEVRGTVQYRW